MGEIVQKATNLVENVCKVVKVFSTKFLRTVDTFPVAVAVVCGQRPLYLAAMAVFLTS